MHFYQGSMQWFWHLYTVSPCIFTGGGCMFLYGVFTGSERMLFGVGFGEKTWLQVLPRCLTAVAFTHTWENSSKDRFVQGLCTEVKLPLLFQISILITSPLQRFRDKIGFRVFYSLALDTMHVRRRSETIACFSIHF